MYAHWQLHLQLHFNSISYSHLIFLYTRMEVKDAL